MPTPQNAYYLRSGPEPGSSSSTQPPAPEPAPEPEPEPALDPAPEPEQVPEPEHIEPVVRNNMAFANITVPHFYGDDGERGDEWLSWFNNYCEVSNQEDNVKRAKMLPFYLQRHARAWYMALQQATKDNWGALTNAFKERFSGNDGVVNDMIVLNIRQQRDESCASYFTRFLQATANRDYNESLLTSVVLNGLKPELKRSVIQFAPQTVEAVRKQANISEQTLAEEATPVIATTYDKSEMDLLREKLDRVLEINANLQQQVNSPKHGVEGVTSGKLKLNKLDITNGSSSGSSSKDHMTDSIMEVGSAPDVKVGPSISLLIVQPKM